MKSTKTIATPPGATIREQLEDRGMTQKEFALRMDLSEKHVSKLINGEVHLTPDVALRLEFVLGIPAKYWNNLEAIYREKCARVQAENEMAQDIEIAKQFPYAEMAKMGWIPSSRNWTEKVNYLRSFFGVAKLCMLDQLRIPGIAYRRTGSNERSDYALAAWAQQVRIEAREREVDSINIGKLESLLPAIRALTLESPALYCPKLQDIMAQCGIALVFLPHIKRTFLHGASFLDSNKVVMGLTARGRDADRFWFSLFHEIAHILKGHIAKVGGTTEEDERDADAFAAETLIPQSALHAFCERNVFTVETVTAFAEEIGVHPGIVVGRLQKENHIAFSQMHQLKQTYLIGD